MGRPLHFIVPGALNQRTGGYIYDRKIVEGLRAAGWAVEVHELAGRFPVADGAAVDAASAALRTMGGGIAIIDGLALPAFQDLAEHVPKPWVGLIHHPLAMETGLSEQEVVAFIELESRLMGEAGKLIVTSPRTKRDLKGFDVDPEKVSVVVPGVEPADLALGSGKCNPTSLLCVGTLTLRKGHLVLLRALAELHDLDWHLTVVGSTAWDTEHAGTVMEAIEKLGLTERVTMIGEQDDAGLSGFYHQADLFVLASHHEGYGMVLAEALARGLPIISTTAGAIPDTVPSAAGYLVPPGDVDVLAVAIRRVLTDRDLFDGLKQGAEGARSTLPSWGETAHRFAATLEELITS